ncbi:MAG TPA: FeoB-associated Cys-rich membrane protein [Cryomorphaceae bacterium]|nr:FeoB-associated Cys-rich membrane protein [Cryomorphaceae bacterium]
MWQDVFVWILFAAVIGFALYRRFKKRKGGNCAGCEFNPQSGKGN